MASDLGTDPEPVQVDRIIKAHYKHVVDAITRERVDEDSTLAALYTFDDYRIDNKLLKNLTGIADPSVYCQLVHGTGKLFPPTTDSNKHGYSLYQTFNDLLLAPTVRLECRCHEKSDKNSVVYHTIALEFHFNGSGSRMPGISAFAFHDTLDPQMEKLIFLPSSPEFISSSGFNKVDAYQNSFGEEEREVKSVMEQYSDHPRTIELLMRKIVSPDIAKIRARLPNGAGILLPSIGAVEYASFGSRDKTIYIGADGPLKPSQLMNKEPPFAMVPYKYADTFPTTKRAAVELSVSACIADLEANKSLELWANPDTPHRATMYKYENHAVITVEKRKFRQLGSARADGKYLLPKKLYTDISFETREGRFKVKAFRMELPPAGIPAHDYVFIITSLPVKKFGTLAKHPNEGGNHWFDVQFKPHHNSFTLRSQMSAVQRLCSDSCRRWHGILLNQRHEQLPIVDLTCVKGEHAEYVSDRFSKAFERLKTFKT